MKDQVPQRRLAVDTEPWVPLPTHTRTSLRAAFLPPSLLRPPLDHRQRLDALLYLLPLSALPLLSLLFLSGEPAPGPGLRTSSVEEDNQESESGEI